MPSLCLGWGIAQSAMAACHSYGDLLAARFFLGLFEAGCLPLFSIITSQWFRRAEQPIRVAAWYSTNGLATIVAAALSYGLGHIPSSTLASWQIIFLFVGLVTIVTCPFVYWKLDNDIPSARFLSEEDKPKAIERLRANQTGTGSREFKWSHILELALEPKTYLWVGLSMLLNVGASVTNTFGPLILEGLGFSKCKLCAGYNRPLRYPLTIPDKIRPHKPSQHTLWCRPIHHHTSLLLGSATLQIKVRHLSLYHAARHRRTCYAIHDQPYHVS